MFRTYFGRFLGSKLLCKGKRMYLSSTPCEAVTAIMGGWRVRRAGVLRIPFGCEHVVLYVSRWYCAVSSCMRFVAGTLCRCRGCRFQVVPKPGNLKTVSQ